MQCWSRFIWLAWTLALFPQSVNFNSGRGEVGTLPLSFVVDKHLLDTLFHGCDVFVVRLGDVGATKGATLGLLYSSTYQLRPISPNREDGYMEESEE